MNGVNALKKLSDDQIVFIENWAKEKKKNPMSNEEKELVSKIESFSRNNWKGMRLENPNHVDDLKNKLERLKRKAIN
jgi:hypothetical protein